MIINSNIYKGSYDGYSKNRSKLTRPNYQQSNVSFAGSPKQVRTSADAFENWFDLTKISGYLTGGILGAACYASLVLLVVGTLFFKNIISDLAQQYGYSAYYKTKAKYNKFKELESNKNDQNINKSKNIQNTKNVEKNFSPKEIRNKEGAEKRIISKTSRIKQNTINNKNQSSIISNNMPANKNVLKSNQTQIDNSSK